MYNDPDGQVVAEIVIGGLIGGLFGGAYKFAEIMVTTGFAYQSLWDTWKEIATAAGGGGIAGVAFMGVAAGGGALAAHYLPGTAAAWTFGIAGTGVVGFGALGGYNAAERAQDALDVMDEQEMTMAVVDAGFSAAGTLVGTMGMCSGFGRLGFIFRAKPKVPASWGKGVPNSKKVGWRWSDPNNNSGNTIRVDKGDPRASLESQRVDHVRINYEGKVIGRDGKALSHGKSAEAHIPLTEWLNWSTWHAP